MDLRNRATLSGKQSLFWYQRWNGCKAQSAVMMPGRAGRLQTFCRVLSLCALGFLSLLGEDQPLPRFDLLCRPLAASLLQPQLTKEMMSPLSGAEVFS